MTLETCTAHCETADGLICTPTEDGTIAKACYQCLPKPVEPAAVMKADLCADGTTSDKAECDKQCENGLCFADETQKDRNCYSCVLCPDETYSTEPKCARECVRSCEVTAAEGELSCWGCPDACEKRCADQGFRLQEDYSDFIAAKLLPKECVSGVSLTIARATIGSCSCTKEPEIVTNDTLPVCSGTPCGDVACGETVTCYSNTLEVSCVWLGWQKEAMNQFRPGIQTRIVEINGGPKGFSSVSSSASGSLGR